MPQFQNLSSQLADTWLTEAAAEQHPGLTVRSLQFVNFKRTFYWELLEKISLMHLN